MPADPQPQGVPSVTRGARHQPDSYSIGGITVMANSNAQRAKLVAVRSQIPPNTAWPVEHPDFGQYLILANESSSCTKSSDYRAKWGLDLIWARR